MERVPTMLPIAEVIKRIPELSYNYLRQGCLRGEIIHIRVGNRFLINFDKLCEKLNQGD